MHRALPLLLAAVLLALGAPAASAVTIDEFPAAGGPLGIASGPDGNLWFTELDGARVSRMSTAGAVVGSTPIAGADLSEIITGPDGNLWFTDLNDRVGRITPGGVRLPDITLPLGSEPVDLAVGSDGNVWVTLPGRSRIARISAAGVVLSQTLLPGNRAPEGIAAGPDGALWFTEPDDNRVGRITTGLAVTEFVLPNPDSTPIGIAAGADGALWFTEADGNRIGRITTAGAIAEFPIPTVDSAPEGIAAGPDGNLWFTEAEGNQIGRITPSGAITEFPIPTPSSEPVGITAGPDGRMWFTELNVNRIGRLTLDGPAATTGAATGITTTSATLNGSVDPNAAATSYRFEYGTTTAYGSSTPTASAGAGDEPVAVSAQLTGLEPGTTYHYRLVATSAVGTSFGADQSFTAGVPAQPAPAPPSPVPAPPAPPTGGPPLLSAAGFRNVGPRGVTLTGRLDPNGLATRYRAECGSGPGYGLRTPLRDAGAVTGDRAVARRVRGLRPGTRYRCRLVAINEQGTAHGSVQRVVTPVLLRLSFADRMVTVPAGVPVTLRFRSTARVLVRGRLKQRGLRGAGRGLRLRARPGINRLRLGPLSAGSYLLTVRARTGDGQRVVRRVGILAVAQSPPRYTG